MKLTNRENQPFESTNGDIIWRSRSIAICAIVISNDLDCVVTKRSDKVDNPGKWSLPCGYLDWDESIHQALIRELWEELGLDVRGKFAGLYHVSDGPNKDERQNVSFHFIVAPDCSTEELRSKIKLCDEATEFDFISLDEAKAGEFGDKEFAFGHDKRIMKSVDADPNEVMHTCILDLDKGTQFTY